MKRTVILVSLVVVAGVGGCATSRASLVPEVGAVVQVAGPLSATEDDELRAYAPEMYLAGLAGHGLGGDLDLSASCGCAETSSSGPTGASGPSGGPGVEHKQTARLRVIVNLPTVPVQP
jgi:uncharacterized protein YceK